MRYLVEHLRAIDAPGTPLGVEWLATGRTTEVDAADEAEAAALALTVGDDAVDAVGYDPGRNLYAVPGEDEAVRVSPAG